MTNIQSYPSRPYYPLRVTEVDMFDAEGNEYLAFANCDECGEPERVGFLVKHNGGMLCAGCDYKVFNRECER